MAFLSGVHPSLPVATVNCVQTLKADDTFGCVPSIYQAVGTVRVSQRQFTLEDAIEFHTVAALALLHACDQCV
jgi:hypothetical protein